MRDISIHTTRVGGDLKVQEYADLTSQFQSTPPVWVVTLKEVYKMAYVKISIHTTRVGGDSAYSDSYSEAVQFQSTPPVWVVTN